MCRFFFLFVLACCLASCQPNRKYTVFNDMVVGTQGLLGISGRDTLKVGDQLKVRKALGESDAFVKNMRTGHTHHVSSDSLFNIETGHTLRQDLSEAEQGNLWDRIKKVPMTKEQRQGYERMTVIGLTVLLVALVAGLILCCVGELSRMKVGIAYALVSVCSWAANYLFFKCATVEEGSAGHGFFSYLFSVGEYGWLKTIFFWVVFFVLAAANLLGYKATLLLSEAWSGRRLYSTHVFLALAVWFVIYLFSSNELNDEFLWVLLGIMSLHLVAVIVQNVRSHANWFEMCYIYLYFWGCLLPVFLMTATTLVLLPVALLFLVFVRSIPGMVAAGFSTEPSGRVPEKQKNAPNPKQKACVFCSHYDMSSGRCGMTSSQKDRYGSDAYSCPYYS